MKAEEFVKSTLADDAEVKRLAGLPILEFDRQYKASAKKLKCSGSALKAAVKAERAKNNPASASKGGQGQPIQISAVETWPDPVGGAATLDALVAALRNYVVLTDAQLWAAALWAAYTHSHEEFDVSPKLILSSPTKQCGKTRFIEVLSRVVERPLPVSGISPAALLRLIERHSPTLLLDEMDTMMKGNREMAEALRGLLNSGFDRNTARLIINVPIPGGDWEPRAFLTWCPQLLGGIGQLPDTVRDRSVIIAMHRKPRSQKVSRLRRKDGNDLHDIARKLARWASDNATALRDAVPEVPAGLSDRAADAWEPLFAIASLAGGDWPQRARTAALALSGDTADDENSVPMLLADIREIFSDLGEQHVSSADLTDALNAKKDRPWPPHPPMRNANTLLARRPRTRLKAWHPIWHHTRWHDEG